MMYKFLLLSLMLFAVSCDSPVIQRANVFFAEYISAPELKNLLDNKESILVIDTRRPMLYNNSHIPGAINIPAAQIDKITEKISIAVSLVIYDANTAYAKTTIKRLHYLGYTDVKVLSGGFPTWSYKTESN